MIVKDGVNTKVFRNFIIQLLENNANKFLNINGYTILLDNAPKHRAKIVKPPLEKLGMLYNAPYSPFKNPIEEYFSLIKHYYRK